jgi:hypothetical protein
MQMRLIEFKCVPQSTGEIRMEIECEGREEAQTLIARAVGGKSGEKNQVHSLDGGGVAVSWPP